MIKFKNEEELNKYIKEQGLVDYDIPAFSKENMQRIAQNTLDEMEGETRINLKVKKEVVAKYKAKAKRMGVPYYSLINMTLYENAPKNP